MPGDQADPSSSGAVTAGGPAPEPSGSTVISTQNGVEVFYLGRSDGLLYREIRNLPNVGDRLNTAITAVLSVAPLDPEYTSSWSGGQVNGATVDGDRITLDLSQSAFAGFHSQHQEEAAIQQLVYAATAAVDNGQNRWVRILVDGSPNLPLIGKPQADFKRGGANILGPMWVDSPLAGATESSGTLNISGLVRSSLPAPGWQLYSVSQQKVVAKGTVATGSQHSPWTAWQQEVPLPETAGEYQVILVIGQQQAIKTITVR
nr:GerMN domain-containing protein [Acidipropionibacterium jensenii]